MHSARCSWLVTHLDVRHQAQACSQCCVCYAVASNIGSPATMNCRNILLHGEHPVFISLPLRALRAYIRFLVVRYR